MQRSHTRTIVSDRTISINTDNVCATIAPFVHSFRELVPEMVPRCIVACYIPILFILSKRFCHRDGIAARDDAIQIWMPNTKLKKSCTDWPFLDYRRGEPKSYCHED